MKSSLQRELDQFYQQVNQSDFQIRQVTKSAFSQSRLHLRPEAFLELNEEAYRSFYETEYYLCWKDRRLLSCDGSRLVLPNHKTVIEEFGQTGFGPKADGLKSLAITSMLYDPLNLITLDAQLAPFKGGSEKELLDRHFSKLEEGDILLLDRGYPSISLFYRLMVRGVDFCVRMKDDWWLPVKEFKESEDNDRIVTFSLPKKDRNAIQDFPEMYDKPIECRLVKVELPNGSVEILCTSLTDGDLHSIEDIAELYEIRWGIEENYKLFKARAEVECFSGKTAIAVKQDFYATVFVMTMCSILSFPINEKVIEETMNDPEVIHIQQLNRTSALSWTRAATIALFTKAKINEMIIGFDSIMEHTTEIVRPGRKSPRKKRGKQLHFMNYKRL